MPAGHRSPVLLQLRQADFLRIQLFLDPQQHGVVDAVTVAQGDHGGALVLQQSQTQGGLLLLGAAAALPTRVARSAGGVHRAQVRLVFGLQPLGDISVDAQIGCDLAQSIECGLRTGARGEGEFFLPARVPGQTRPAGDRRRTSPWTTRAETTTPEVTKTIVSRSGNAAPESTV